MEILLPLMIFAAFVLLYVRFAPSTAENWHVNPLEARPGAGRFVVRPEGGDASFGPVPVLPAVLLSTLDAVAASAPRTRRLAGSVSEGRITYVSRSRLLGFPDYTTVQVIETPDGASLAVFARLRFGRKDFGVNRARVQEWLFQLECRLAEAHGAAGLTAA